jgi:formylglycine-generating enzyme required for sulfatase activity
LAENVFSARAEGVSYALDNLRPLGRLAVSFLRARLDDAQGDPVRRLHAAYALADNGETPWEFLIDAVPTAPAAECRNLVAALEPESALALPELARRAASTADSGQKARYAIVALHLGDPRPATDALEVRSDPIHRTTLIHSYAGWHAEVGAATKVLRENDDSACRSGLCAALGTIGFETLEPAERNEATEVLAELYRRAADAGTHAAAGWTLRQWKQEIPLVASTSRAPADRHWFVNAQGMTMVEVAAGTFTMGTSGEAQVAEENPAHEVTLTRPYFLGDREVTVEQFQRFIDDPEFPATEKPLDWQHVFERSQPISPTPDCPVQTVNWFDAIRYCNWLSRREGREPGYEHTGEKEKVKWDNREYELDVWRCDFTADGYRLPTEAEWECAARAGSASEFCYGSDEDLLPLYAWFVVNARARTRPGGAKLPNAAGLLDMHGSVCEWCWDRAASYPAEAVRDPTGSAGGSDRRMFRGGGFYGLASGCRSHSASPIARWRATAPSGFGYCVGLRSW